MESDLKERLEERFYPFNSIKEITDEIKFAAGDIKALSKKDKICIAVAIPVVFMLSVLMVLGYDRLFAWIGKFFG